MSGHVQNLEVIESFKPISLINGLLIKLHGRLHVSQTGHNLFSLCNCYSSHKKVISVLRLIESGQAVIKAVVTLCDLQAFIKVLALLRHSFLESSCHALRKPKLSNEIPWRVHM